MNGYQRYCRYFNSIHVTIYMYVMHWKGRVYTLSTQEIGVRKRLLRYIT